MWRNCTKGEAEILEKIQLAAARVVCGLKKGTSHQAIYDETGWTKLEERRTQQSLIMLYKIINGKAPRGLRALIPETVEASTNRNLRDPSRLRLLRTRTQSYHDSFFPATIREWNALPAATRQKTSLEGFKEAIKNSDNEPPAHYYQGNRREQCFHARMRVGNCDLNQYLFERNLKESPYCNCGDHSETSTHFLLICPLYYDQRLQMLQELDPTMPLSTRTLLFGDDGLSSVTNCQTFEAVQRYIKNTGRFD